MAPFLIMEGEGTAVMPSYSRCADVVYLDRVLRKRFHMNSNFPPLVPVVLLGLAV